MDVFKFKNTIFEKVTPVVLLFIFLKLFIWYLESINMWFSTRNLWILFTIIGFALWIILSQKIWVTYWKYRELEEVMFKMHWKLSSFRFYVKHAMKIQAWKIWISKWLSDFLNIYHKSNHENNRKLVEINEQFYKNIVHIWNTDLIHHHRLTALLSQIFEDASFILSRKTSYTPVAYDNLLMHVTMMYLLMLTVFIPWIEGIVSVFIATYMLYWMYYVTYDFDLAIWNEDKKTLIKLSAKKLENYLKQILIKFK